MWMLWLRADQAYADPKVPLSAFLGVIWTFTAVSFFLLPARLYVRWITISRFFWDDYLVILAWTLSLAIAIATTALSHVTYEVMQIGARKKEFPSNVRTITLQFTRLFNIVPMLLFAGLWSIKFAFLLFFRRLGVRTIPRLHRWWLAVFFTCLITFLICFAILPYKCCFTTFEVVISPECKTQGLSFVTMKVNCALDVLTDSLITTIPFIILRKTRLSTRQRTVLSIVFSLVVITMVFAIIRATLTTSGVREQIDPMWMYMWSSIELNIAIVVACVAPYRTYFLRSRTEPPGKMERELNIVEDTDGHGDSGTRVAPWPDEGDNGKWFNTVNAERPTLGVLPDDSGNWSEIEALHALPKIDEESQENSQG